MEIDWDKEVGFWIKDVPYFWIPGKTENWKHNTRIYLSLMKRWWRKKPKSNFLGLTLPKLEKCDESVQNYFHVVDYSSPDYKFNFGSEQIRVNGKIIHFPKKMLDFTVSEKTIISLYDYIGIKPVYLDINWNKLIVEKDYQPASSPFIELPGENIPPSPPGKKTILRSSYNFTTILIFWYLSNVLKYRNVCVPISSEAPFENTLRFSENFVISIKIGDIKDPETQISTFIDYKKIFRACMRDKKIDKIIIPITWQYTKEGKYGSHANVLVIDKKNKNKDGSMNVYIFDPHGKILVKFFEKRLSIVLKILGLERHTFKIKNVSPELSFQSLEDGKKRFGDYRGFCYAWTIWLIDLFLKNQDIPYEILVRKALRNLSQKDPTFVNFLRRYTKFMEEYGLKKIRKLGLEKKLEDQEDQVFKELSEDELRFKKYKARKLPIEDQIKLKKYILKMKKKYGTE